MPKGNSKAYLNSPFTDNTEVDVNDNALMIQHCLDVFNMKEPDLSNPDETKRAIDQYFKSCIEKGLRPGNLGLYTALGLNRREALNLLQGRIKKNVNPISLAHIKRACKVLSLYRESLGSQGKLNPATLIFWQKNYDGLEDVQHIDVTANAAENANLSPDEIANKIECDVPIDTPFETVNE